MRSSTPRSLLSLLCSQPEIPDGEPVTDEELRRRFDIRCVGCASHARRPFALYEDEDPDYCAGRAVTSSAQGNSFPRLFLTIHACKAGSFALLIASVNLAARGFSGGNGFAHAAA